ncbi:Na+/H+ antiporter NhaC [Lutispora saccharofermentans]|uniref:Na+/H+ antiporter NhaC n=1 Tax=Lutispora saccharofermentans TaxID=3024236 RepID=A0ABT1NKB0_9FIRM|nr:Na+/H+ antiporter NhaC [Lutispora saccharofermentans]MCQ1531534.1 Na+/H+ antiporter NhaC [Lutispora saccharofermentans]
MKENNSPSFGICLFIVISLLVIMGASLGFLGIPVHIAMSISMAVAIAALLYSGVKWDFIISSIEDGGKMAITTVLILFIIGMVMGSWMASGTVPAIIYWGLKLINPKIFLVTACLVCCVVSISTGSSWSTGGTIGVALIAVGEGLGINPAITAGAIVSGAYFGDKMSPLSDTTNLSPAIAEGDLFDHIKSMLYTTTPSLIIALILYGIIGAKYSSDTLDVSSINTTLEVIKQTFNLNFLVWIPPILVIILAIKKVPALISLLFSAIIAALIAVFVQGETISSITTIMDTGFASNVGIASVDKLLSRGGLQNMAYTVTLTLIVMPYGAILEKTQVLSVLLEKFKVLTKSVGSLVTSTVLTAIGLNIVTSSQYMSLVLTGRMYLQAYKDKDMLPQTLSRTLEDSATMTSPLVPWNLCALFFAGALGVPTISYLPYAFLNWISPLVAIIFAWLGLFQWKTGAIYSNKTYRPIDAKEGIADN